MIVQTITKNSGFCLLRLAKVRLITFAQLARLRPLFADATVDPFLKMKQDKRKRVEKNKLNQTRNLRAVRPICVFGTGI